MCKDVSYRDPSSHQVEVSYSTLAARDLKRVWGCQASETNAMFPDSGPKGTELAKGHRIISQGCMSPGTLKALPYRAQAHHDRRTAILTEPTS